MSVCCRLFIPEGTQRRALPTLASCALSLVSTPPHLLTPEHRRHGGHLAFPALLARTSETGNITKADLSEDLEEKLILSQIHDQTTLTSQNFYPPKR